MNHVFHAFLHKFVVVYLDDIVVDTKTLNECIQYLQLVFQVLRGNQLFVKREKCEFVKLEVSFLVYMVGHGMIKMDKAKIQAIESWETPKEL